MVPELWDHEKLLQHGDHVANTTKVDDADLLQDPTLAGWQVPPLRGPRDIHDDWPDLSLEELGHLLGLQILNVPGHQFESRLPRDRYLALALDRGPILGDFLLRRLRVEAE